MNKIYRLVWNKSLSLWTVVSENARGVTKKRNVNTIQTVNAFSSTSLEQNNNLLKLKPSLIALTISSIFFSTGAFAGANMGGGTSNQGSSTAISPTNDQCGNPGQATVNGMPNSVAIGCGSRVNQTNNQVQGIAQRRGGGTTQPYPDGAENHLPNAVAIGNKNVTGAGGGVAIGNANESSATFANVAIGQGNRAVGGGFGTALGIGNLTDGSSNVAIGVANRARGNTVIALGRQTYADADFAIAQGNTATVAQGATGGIAMGNAATTKGVRGIAIGSGTGGANYDATTAANADGADSVAIGTGAKGTGAGSTAVGRRTVASGDSSTAMGDEATAEGNGDVAIGRNAYAKGSNNASATAVGRGARAEGEESLALGNTAKATANFASAVGNFAEATGNQSTASGNRANASADFSSAYGTWSKASGARSSAFGNIAEASGGQSTAIGNATKASGLRSSAFGNFAEASGEDSTASGNGAKATSDFSSAYGNLAEASGIQSTAIGNASKASGLRSSAFGHGAVAEGAESLAMGRTARSTGESSVAVGDSAQARGDHDIAIGYDAATSEGTKDNIAIGHGVTTGDTGQNVAMGSGTTTANAASSEGGAVAIGRDQVARGDGAVAIGDPNNANGNGAVALGRNNTAAGNDDASEAADGAVAIGNENKAIGQGSVALGNASTAAEAGSIALGDSANAQAARGIALGSNAVATNADDVALGAGSVTSTATGDSFLTGIAAPASVVSVGSAGNERRIQHLSDGAEDTDAVNVRQLKHVKDVVDEQGESTANALGGGSTYDPETGAVSNPTYNINGNDMNNVGDALAELDKGWTLQTNGENAGAVKAGDTVDIGTVDGEENLQVEKEGNNIKYSLNRDLKVDSVTAGDTVMNTDGMTIAGGPSVTKSGIDAGGNKITNVAEGTEGTDAVNKDQLDSATAAAKTEVEAGKNMTVESETGADGQTIYTVATADDVEFDSVKVGDVSIDGATGKITGVTAGDVNPDSTDAINGSQLAGTAQSVSDALGGGSTVNPDGTVTAPNYSVNGNDVNNVGDALAELDKGWTLQTNGENAAAVKAGDTVDIGTADGEENLQVVKEGNDIKYSLNRDLKVDSVTAGDTVMNTDGMTIAGGPSVTKDGIDAAGNKITNVADGEVAAGSQEAVNGGQLNDSVGSVGDMLGGGVTNEGGKLNGPFTVNDNGYANVADAIEGETAAAKTEVEAGKNMTVESETGANGQTIYTVATADDVEFDSVKVGDVSIDGATGKITGVTAGDVNPDSTDAINGSQLAGTAQSVSDALGGGSTVNPDGTVTAPNYSVNGTDVNNVGDAIAELDKGWTLQTNGANAAAVKAGDTVDIGTADGEENLQVAKEGNNIKYSLNRDLKVDSVTAGDTVMNTDGMTIAGGPSVTKDGIDAAGNKITNVADGEVAAGSKDAVNGGQLNDSVGSVGDMLGGGVTNEGGKLNGPFTVNDNGYANVADAIEGETAAAKTEVEAGKNMTVESETGANGQTIYTVATADDVEFDSVKVGDVSIDGATGKITGVTAGDVNPDSTDAINGSQLAGTAQSVSDALGGGSTVNPDGTVTAPNYTVNGSDVNNVGDAITALDKGWTLQTNGENAAAVKAGDTVDIGTADGEENLQVVKEGNDIKYSLNRDLKVDSVTAGDTVLNNEGLTIAGGPSVTKDGIDAGGNKITGVAPGTVSPDSTDAINGSQLNAQGEGVRDIIGGDTVYDPETGRYTNPDIGGTGQDNINDAIGSIGQAAREAKTTVSEGENIVVTESKNADGSTNYEVATARDVNFDSVQVGDVNIDGATGKISGVTAGTVSPDSTDAINGSQLAGTAQSVSDALGGGSTVNPDGTVTAPNYTVNGSDVNNVGDAITALDKGWTLQTNGENAAAVKAGDTVDIGTADGEENLQVVKEGNDIKYSLNRDLKVDSVTAGDTVLNNEGLTIAGGPSVTKDGIDAGGNKITGVAAGDVNPDSTDAINGSQLAGTAQSVSDALGGGSTVNPDGTVTAPNYTVNGSDVNNVGDAITALDKGWTLQSNGANAGAVKAGDTVDIGTADGEENLQVAKEGNDIKYSLNRDLKVDSVTAGNTRLDNSGVEVKDAVGNSTTMVAGGTIVKDAQGNSTATTAAGTTIKDAQGNSTILNGTGLAFTDASGAPVGPSVSRTGIDAGGLKLTNVAEGEIAADSKDAINGSQLNDSVGSVGDIIGGGVTNEGGKINGPFTVNDNGYANVADAIEGETAAAKTEVEAGKNMTVESETGADGQTIYTVATADDVEFDSVKVGDVSIDGATGKISGVTAGTVSADSTDAINGSQLHAQGEGVKNIIGGDTVYDPNTGRYTNPDIGGTGKDNINDAIGAVGAAATKAKTTVTEGDNIVVTESTNADGSTNYEVATARDVNFDSVKVGDVNIDGTTGKISGVAAGDVNPDSTDAINGSQLAGTAQSVSDALGGGSTVNPDGTVTAPNYTVNGDSVNNVGDAITALDKGWTLQSNGENAGAVKAGDTVDIGTAEGEENLQVVKEGNDIKYSLNRDLKVDSVTAGDTIINTDGLTIAGGPSVTKEGIDAGGKKLTNVAPGTVSPDSTDAINGSQLHAQGEGVKNIIGGNTTYDPNTGRYTNPNIGGTGQDNINDAIGAVGAAATKAKTTVTEGDNIVVTESTNADGSTNYEVATAKDLVVDSVTAGDTVVNTDGLTIAGGPSVTKEGINAGNQKITGVAAGDVNPDSTDAINGSQLAGTAQSVSDALGGGSTVNPDGTVTAPNYTVNGDSVNNVGDAITALDKGWTLQSNGENAGAVKAGDTVDIGTADGEENLQVSKEGNDIKYSLNRDLKVDSVTAGDTVINTDGLTIAGGPSVTKDGIDAGGKKLTNVAPGTVSPDSTDAINGSQLHAQGEGVKNIIGGNTTYDPNTGRYTNPNIGGTGKDNINDAIGAVGDAAKAAKTTVTEGDNIVVSETKNADGSTNYEVATAKDVKFDSVTSTDDEGNETVLTAKGTQVKDGEGNEAEYGAKGITLQDKDGNGTVLNQGGLSFVDPMGNNIGPSITAGGINAGNTVIGGVAAGRVAADSQDAINGSQLRGVSDSVANSIGGNTTVNDDGTINTSNVGNTGKDNVHDAIDSVRDAAEKAKSTVSEGKNIVVKESKNADGSTDYEVSTSPDIEVDSVTAGDTRVDGDGLHIEGGPSVTKDGIDAGDKKITGVEDGTIAEGSKDAINGGQVKGITDSVRDAIGGNTTVNEDGTINASDIGGTGHDNINDAIASVKNEAKGAKATVSKGDDNVTVKTKQNADGSTDYEVGLSDKIKVKEVDADQVNAGQVNVKGDNGSTTITGGGVSISGPNGEQGPSMTTDGINAGGKKVKGVADGRIEKGSQEAINGGQLHQSYEDVGAALGGGAGYDPEKGWKGPSYNVAGGSYNNVGDALGAIDDRVTNLGDQMQQAFYDTNQRIDDVKKHANAGIAAAMALEAAPYLAGKYTYAVGAAYHGGENAVGVTLRKTADNGRWSLSGGVAAASQGDPSFRVGLSGSFN